MVFLRAVVFCLLCSVATCARDKMLLDKIQVESEGIDDYDMAPEYEDVWTNDATLSSLEDDATSQMNDMNLGISDLKALDKENLIRRSWLLENQKKVNTEGCPSLVLWCEPSRMDFDLKIGFKSVLITREKGWGDKFKSLASNNTNCGRVGFEVFQDGKLLKDEADMKTTAFNMMYGLKYLRWITTLFNVGDVPYLEHCEWLRRRPFDMRHAVECVKHSKLCTSRGEATAIPYASQNPKEVSRETSKHGPASLTFGENSKPAVEIFAEALEEREAADGKVTKKTCIKLLCKYKGFKKASLKLHPDRLIRTKLTEEEKEEKTNEFKYLVNCKDGFKGPDGAELTLNKKEDRESLCE